jgi:hypothetical protein
MVKFERSTLLPVITPEEDAATLTISGSMLHDESLLTFAGKDTIKVMQK